MLKNKKGVFIANIMTIISSNLSAGNIWAVVLTIIPLFASITGISIGVYLIWRLLNWRFDTYFHKRAAKRSFRSF